MFKQLSPAIIEKMKEDGRVILTVKKGWETATSIHAIPYKINLYIGNNMEHLFDCYLQIYGSTIVISDIRSSSIIADKKNLVDGYLYLAINGLMKFAKAHDKNRMIVDTEIKYAADHLPHYGFKLISETDCPTKSIKGIIVLK